MIDSKKAAVVAALLLVTPARAALAEERHDVAQRPMALGFQLDLLPTVASAAARRLGYAPQLWLGIDHVRLRLVGAYIVLPDGLASLPDGFHHASTAVFAAVFDYTFGPRFDGPWLGSGFEVWHRTVEHDDVAEQATWSNTVFTLGGGYIFRVSDHLLIDPWAAAHVTLDPTTVHLGGDSWNPPRISAEASLKIGWIVDL
jgi:hypothetical protein